MVGSCRSADNNMVSEHACAGRPLRVARPEAPIRSAPTPHYTNIAPIRIRACERSVSGAENGAWADREPMLTERSGERVSKYSLEREREREVAGAGMERKVGVR